MQFHIISLVCKRRYRETKGKKKVKMSKETKYVYFFGCGQTEGNAEMRNL